MNHQSSKFQREPCSNSVVITLEAVKHEPHRLNKKAIVALRKNRAARCKVDRLGRLMGGRADPSRIKRISASLGGEFCEPLTFQLLLSGAQERV